MNTNTDKCTVHTDGGGGDAAPNLLKMREIASAHELQVAVAPFLRGAPPPPPPAPPIRRKIRQIECVAKCRYL